VSCRALQFAFVVGVLQVQTDVLLGRLEEFGHVLLGQPDGFVFEANFNLRPPVFECSQFQNLRQVSDA